MHSYRTHLPTDMQRRHCANTPLCVLNTIAVWDYWRLWNAPAIIHCQHTVFLLSLPLILILSSYTQPKHWRTGSGPQAFCVVNPEIHAKERMHSQKDVIAVRLGVVMCQRVHHLKALWMSVPRFFLMELIFPPKSCLMRAVDIYTAFVERNMNGELREALKIFPQTELSFFHSVFFALFVSLLCLVSSLNANHHAHSAEKRKMQYLPLCCLSVFLSHLSLVK